MPKEAIFCLALSRDLADQIVDRMKTSGISNHDVSALFPDHATTRDLAQGTSARMAWRERPPASQRSAWWTARHSGFASIGSLTIPGAGPFVAAGPIIFALSGAIVGGAGGGLAGALIALGISEFEAGRYENKIKEGNILISVYAENPDEINRAKAIFKEAGAQEICTTGEDSPARENSTTGHASYPAAAARNRTRP